MPAQQGGGTMSRVKTGRKVVGALGMAAVGLGIPLYTRFRRDMQAAQERLEALGSQVVDTACGPIEYATVGEGYPVLVVHGIVGGFDAGLASVGDTRGQGYQLIVPSRFG